jgi:predicted RND superfamily exporter protein
LALTEDLVEIAGIRDVRSLSRGPGGLEETLEQLDEDDVDEILEDVAESPLWSELIMAPDGSATFLVIQLAEDADLAATIRAIDTTLEGHADIDFELGASGVPYVAEHVRTRLTDELRRFTIVAFVAFAVLVALLFRSGAIVIGTMIAASSASFATFLVRSLAGMGTDLLSPNLWMIAFVLTLSHVVYLTATWRRRAPHVGSEQAAKESVALNGPASLWSLLANLLGFATLLFVSAKPIQQFGISGVIAATAAIVCAYGLYPPFLRAAIPRPLPSGGLHARLDNFFTRRHTALALGTIAVGLLLAPFAWRVDTDPTLPSYFSEGDPIRTGLERIDTAGGSSSLDLVVADANGATLASDLALDRLMALQRDLDEHGDVGGVISLALLMAEAERPWYSFLLSWDFRFDRMESDSYDRIARRFVTPDRLQGRFILRMREHTRDRPRDEVVGEIEEIVRSHGFEPVLVGGLYPLQSEMSHLVDGGVVRGLGGLIACFSVIMLFVSRSVGTALAMVFCLALTPMILFGLVGLIGIPLDIISAPAANVALSLGIDEMIHLGYAVRRNRGERANAWRKALSQLWVPILYSALIVGCGFALLLFSSFPPTRHLGVLVSLGAILTDLVVLVVLGLALPSRPSPSAETDTALSG